MKRLYWIAGSVLALAVIASMVANRTAPDPQPPQLNALLQGASVARRYANEYSIRSPAGGTSLVTVPVTVYRFPASVVVVGDRFVKGLKPADGWHNVTRGTGPYFFSCTKTDSKGAALATVDLASYTAVDTEIFVSGRPYSPLRALISKIVGL